MIFQHLLYTPICNIYNLSCAEKYIIHKILLLSAQSHSLQRVNMHNCQLAKMNITNNDRLCRPIVNLHYQLYAFVTNIK